MKIQNFGWCLAWAALPLISGPAMATVSIAALSSKLKSPQPIGTIVDWAAEATDTNSGPLTFQFNVAAPGGTLVAVKNFNMGTLSGSTWKSQNFAWALTGSNGMYHVQVVAKDFTSGETASRTVSFIVTSPLIGATPIVQSTQNPLVALFVAPPCAEGSTVRVSFQSQSGSTPATYTNWRSCASTAVMTFEIAGMYPSTAYNLFAQVNNGSTVVNGPDVSFTTGAIPSTVPIPKFQVGIAAGTSDPNPVTLHTFFNVREHVVYPNVATDLSGNVIWYNYASDEAHTSALTRPLLGGYLAIQNGTAWDSKALNFQYLREIDWAGNIVRETNTGIVQQQVMALGDPDAAPCHTFSSPPPVGAACLGIFTHDAIQSLPNGYTAALMGMEKIFPPGTQGDTSGLPVDVVGNMIVVLDQNWNAVWYWDAFDPAGGGNGYPQMPVSRPAVLNEKCTPSDSECLNIYMLGPGVAAQAYDWLHGNSLYYWPNDGAATTAPGDILWSTRNQDWVLKINYQDGAGNGTIDWRMGPSGDFDFVNQYNDPWPWFSHQHDAGVENGGTGVFDVMDNGNTRVSPGSGTGSSTGGVVGLGKDCGPADCHSRGMALTIAESAMQVMPVISIDLGSYSSSMGSAQLLNDGNYFFMPAASKAGKDFDAYMIEIQPTPGTDTGTQVMNVAAPSSYRGWQLPDLYSPPET